MIIIDAILPEKTIRITLEPHNTLRDVVKAVNDHFGNQNPRIYSTNDVSEQYRREHLDIRLDKLGFIEGEDINLLPVEEWILSPETNLSNLDTPIAPPTEEKLSPQISQKITPSIEWSALPSGPLSVVFNFFTLKTLAICLSVVSKTFLTSANELENEEKEKKPYLIQKISFMPGRNAELDDLINELKHMTYMQCLLLKTGYQQTPVNYQLFLHTRGEILAGRLSLQQTLEQIDILMALDQPLSRTDLLLEKKWKACLQLKQQQALQLGFTWLDLLSSWMSLEHVKIFDQPAEEGSQWTVENLRGLQDYQVEGLAKGFSLENVKADWFAPIHVRKTTLVSSHRQDWDAEESVEMTVEESKAHTMTPDKDSGQTPLYFAARLGITTEFSDLLQEGEFTSEECKKLFTRPLAWGPHEGMTPFFIAVLCGHADILITMLDAGEFTLEQRRKLITEPLKSGSYAGKTPLLIAARLSCKTVLKVMQDVGQYTSKELKNLINLSQDQQPPKYRAYNPILWSRSSSESDSDESGSDADEKEPKHQLRL